MAGTDSRFDSAKFRSAIKFAMRMGFPEETIQQITWHWNPNRVFKKTDSGGFPLDWAASQVQSESDISDVIVDCAVKFVPVGGGTRIGGTELGVFDVASAVVTLLDVDHDALVAHGNNDFPDTATMDGDLYIVNFTAPPYGLFDVIIYDVHLQAVDET